MSPEAQGCITFARLCRLEPRLRVLQARVRAVKGGPNFCANAVWYRDFKPEVVRLVGWSRGVTEEQKRAYVDQTTKTKTLAGGLTVRTIDFAVDVEPPTPQGPEELTTSEAYMVAYHALYELLPDCGRCGRWPC